MNEPKKTFTMMVKDNRYAVWLIGEESIPPELKSDDGSTTKHQLINALSALDITADSWKHDLTYNKEQRVWFIRLNEKMRMKASTANWGPNNTPWMQAKFSRTNEDAEKRTVYLAGLSPGGAESVDNLKAAITGWCQMKGAKAESITIAKDIREEHKARIIAESAEDKSKLMTKAFTYLMGDGVVVFDRKESEEQARERMWKRTLQIAAVPMGLRAGELEEVRLWMGAEAVKIPANMHNGKRGDIAYFTFDSEATAKEYIGSMVYIKNAERKVVRLFDQQGSTFKRVSCCWTCGDPAHMKHQCPQPRRGMISENDLLNYAAGVSMTAGKEKRIGEVIRTSAIKQRDIYRGNEIAYSAALKRAGAISMEESKTAIRMVQNKHEDHTVIATTSAWKTQKMWGAAAQNSTSTAVTDQSVNDRLNKMEKLLSDLGRQKEEGDRMEMDGPHTGAIDESVNSTGTKKRPRKETGGYEDPVEGDWLQRAQALEQKAKERALYVDQQLGRLTDQMASLTGKVDKAFRAIMTAAEDTASTTEQILRALVAKGIMEMGPQVVRGLHAENADSAQSGSQHLNDVGKHQ